MAVAKHCGGASMSRSRRTLGEVELHAAVSMAGDRRPWLVLSQPGVTVIMFLSWIVSRDNSRVSSEEITRFSIF